MIDYQSLTELRKAKQELLRKLFALDVPKLSHCADPDELMNMKAHLEKVCEAVDAYVAKLGEQAQLATTAYMDDRHFQQPMFSALDGNALYELESAAEQVREDMREVA